VTTDGPSRRPPDRDGDPGARAGAPPSGGDAGTADLPTTPAPGSSAADPAPTAATTGAAPTGAATSAGPPTVTTAGGSGAEGPRVLAGRYDLGEVLGRGGMAVVRVAHDRVLHRQVAIKLLRPDLAQDPEVLSRFRREARSVAALNHPAVVGVHDVGEDAPGPHDARTPFLVMELVRGATVRDLLDQHRPAPDEDHVRHDRAGQDQPGVGVEMAVAITTGVLEALAYSHRAGIVHRDIKPANVMLTPDGQVKVMDFGIARALADAASTSTHTSAVLGTALYLSPEQARGLPVDARADLYSTGCLLYELLTGRPPFRGDSAVSLAYQHVNEPPEPPSALHPGLPAALDHVVLRAMAKDLADRYPDADAFRRDLEDAARGVDVAPPSAVAAASTTAMPAAAAQLVPVPLEEPEDDGPPADQRGRRAVVVLVALVGLALVALAAVLVPQLLGDGDGEADLRTVPRVVGQTREAARAAVEQQGLLYAETTAASADVGEGRVVEQDPAGSASAPEGSTVAVVVSAGPSAVAVPELTGRTEAQALRALQDAGLLVGELDRVPDPRVAEGSVVRSDPSVGASAEPGSAVDLVLSDGTVEVDDYTGLPVLAAQEAVAALGLQSSLEYQESGQEENTVLDQRPGRGVVPQGSTVVLVVATAPPPAPAPSPTPSPTATDTPTATPTEPDPTAEPTPTDGPTPTGPAPSPTPTGTATTPG